MNKDTGIVHLIQKSIEMYLDRDQAERDLIYHVAKMSNEEHLALILAYQDLMDKEKNE